MWIDHHLGDEQRDSIGSAIDAAVKTCHETELRLVVEPEFVIDVILNCGHGNALRPEFRRWINQQINCLPNLDSQQRECIRAMAFPS